MKIKNDEYVGWKEQPQRCRVKLSKFWRETFYEVKFGGNRGRNYCHSGIIYPWEVEADRSRRRN